MLDDVLSQQAGHDELASRRSALDALFGGD